MLRALFFLLPILLEAAQIEWPFFAKDDDLILNLTIGTPGNLSYRKYSIYFLDQNTTVSLQYFYTTDNLEIVSAQIGGDYDNNASSTWKYLGSTATDNAGNVIGLYGSEAFKLGNFNFRNGSFTLRNKSFESVGHMGFGPPTTFHNFLSDLTDSFIQKKFFVAFDKFPTSGAITFGSIDKKRCYNDWRDLTQIYWYNDYKTRFGLNLTTISIGKTTFNNPGKLFFSMYAGDFIIWPKDMRSKILKELGSTDDEFISCNATLPLVFKVENIEIQLKPADYLDTDMPDGKCGLLGEATARSTEFMFPQIFFRDHCLSIDNSKRVIAIATRRPEKPV